MKHRLLIAGIIASILAGLILISAMVWSGLSNRLSAKNELLTNIGEIARIDEVLTSSALLATATGEQRYVDRYYANVDTLDRLLARSMDLFDSDAARQMLEQTNNANMVLVSVEEKALEIADAPNPDAYQTLDSKTYRENKRLYSEGVARAFDELRLIAGRDIDILRWILIGLAALTATFCIVSLLLVWRGRSLAVEQARRDNRINAMQILISTFIDTQNSLLNNLIFLRTKAAMGKKLSAEDIRIIDNEVGRAQQKLSEIAEFGRANTRKPCVASVIGKGATPPQPQLVHQAAE